MKVLKTVGKINEFGQGIPMTAIILPERLPSRL
jgi:hypothetical protein